jgi:transcriptional regulator with GAF, ATPase, and Fis domain
LEELAAQVPENFRQSFFRDRKRERILSELTSLEEIDPSFQTQPSEEEPMNPLAFTEMARITRLLASGQNLNYLLETILEESLDLLKAERGFILLFEEGDFRVKVVRNIDRKILEENQERFSQTIARQAALKGQAVLVKNAQADERFREAESVMGLGIRAALSVPMKIGAQTLGVIYLDNRFRSEGFEEGNQKILETFADQAALAIRNARQSEEIQVSEQKLASSLRQIEELNGLLKERLEKKESEYVDLKEKYHAQQGELQLRHSYHQIVGQSKKLKEVLKIIDRVTDSDATVLITEKAERARNSSPGLHYNSPRARPPWQRTVRRFQRPFSRASSSVITKEASPGP